MHVQWWKTTLEDLLLIFKSWRSRHLKLPREVSSWLWNRLKSMLMPLYDPHKQTRPSQTYLTILILHSWRLFNALLHRENYKINQDIRGTELATWTKVNNNNKKTESLSHGFKYGRFLDCSFLRTDSTFLL